MHSNDPSVSQIASNFLPLPILPFLYLWLNHSKLNVEVSTHITKPQNKADHAHKLHNYVQMSLLELLLSKCLDFQRISVALLRIQHRMRTMHAFATLARHLHFSRTNALFFYSTFADVH